MHTDWRTPWEKSCLAFRYHWMALSLIQMMTHHWDHAYKWYGYYSKKWLFEQVRYYAMLIPINQGQSMIKKEFNSMEERLKYAKAAPNGYKAMAALGNYVDDCGLEPLLLELVNMRASQLNG